MEPRTSTRQSSHSPLYPLFTIMLILAGGNLFPVRPQQLSSLERERGRIMLKVVRDDVKEHYYDPSFHGVDLDASFKAADEKIKQATSNSQVFAIIAQALLDLKDSHTFFVPPMRGFRVEYGWQMQMFGDACHITVVKPGTDAEAKGLKPGDMVHTIDGYKPARENLWTLNYLFRALWPRSAQQLVVQSPGGQPRKVEIASKVIQGKKLLDLTNTVQFHDFIVEIQSEDYLRRHRFQEVGDDLLIWKMPQFDLSDKELERIMSRVKSRKNLILDLRGNFGGYVDTMRYMVGYFIGKEIKISEMKGRKEMKPVLAKKAGAFEGKLIVLVDSDSASAAEVFARVMQLEKRATILGDQTSGSVMQSLHHPRESGTDTLVLYGTSITNADVIMTDGKSLERAGVVPDEVLLPTGADLAARRDPVLVRAGTLLEVKIEPEKAGTFFPIEWPK